MAYQTLEFLTKEQSLFEIGDFKAQQCNVMCVYIYIYIPIHIE